MGLKGKKYFAYGVEPKQDHASCRKTDHAVRKSGKKRSEYRQWVGLMSYSYDECCKTESKRNSSGVRGSEGVDNVD